MNGTRMNQFVAPTSFITLDLAASGEDRHPDRVQDQHERGDEQHDRDDEQDELQDVRHLLHDLDALAREGRLVDAGHVAVEDVGDGLRPRWG